MYKYILFLGIVLGVSSSILAQNKFVIALQDSEEQPISDAHIALNNQLQISDSMGELHSPVIAKDSIYLHISHINYKTLDTLIASPYSGARVRIILQSKNILDAVNIIAQKVKQTTVHSIQVDKQYIADNFDGSLAKSLDRLPGVQSIGIGGGMSKPLIRGLGFNRIVVADNGMKLEGQQWGVDHGLEVDAFGVEDVHILKGANALAYGSDAIGGVLEINNNAVPKQKGLQIDWITYAKSVNKAIGSSLGMEYKRGKFFAKLRATGAEYGDYKTTTDTINYLNYRIPIYDKIMQNTAGREYNWDAQVGIATDEFTSSLRLGNVYQKSGFFPGSHGIPSIDRVQPDGRSRNISFPYQQVSHFTFGWHNAWRLKNHELILDVGFQRNHRQEWSWFHTHYAGQPKPEVNPDLEMDFLLETYQASIKDKIRFNNLHSVEFGAQWQHKQNNIDGFGFLLPAYKDKQIGFYGIYNFKSNYNNLWTAGIRFDNASLNLHSYYDFYLEAFLLSLGKDLDEAQEYAQRSPDFHKNFSSWNTSIGWKHLINESWDLQINAGTNFRFPTPIELGANGIHHGSFRHEKGDTTLDPEKGWVIDLQLGYKDSIRGIETKVTPYLHYFTNYIYLKPTGSFSLLPHSGQLYQFTQSKALHTGLEWQVSKQWGENWNSQAVFEYIYNQQRTGLKNKNYPLPFTPANNLFLEVEYQTTLWDRISNPISISGYAQFTDKQTRIAQGEQTTPSSRIYGLAIQHNWQTKLANANIQLRVDNLFNTKYYSHTSFYRTLSIPEMARNIQVVLQLKSK